jgi:hypothetical protein
MNIAKFVGTFGLVLASAGAQASASNLVVNGSFEDNLQASETWKIYNSLSGWTSGKYGIELRDNVAGKAQEGLNFVELDTTANSMMKQYINIKTPGTYELSFWYAARPDNGTRKANTDELGWNFGGASGVVLPKWNAAGATDWNQFVTNISFDKDHTGLQVLKFKALGKSDSYGGSVDNISVSAVPEPETYAMMLAGLGLVGVAARRRKQKSAA